jgi:prolyl-tRNA synthetase
VALFEKARAFRDANTRDASTYEGLKEILENKGGFVRCYFKPDRANEKKIKDETKATVRCIPFEQAGGSGKDIITGEETSTQVLFATAY